MNVRPFARSGFALIALTAAALLPAACSSDSGGGGEAPSGIAATLAAADGGASAAATGTPSGGGAPAAPAATPSGGGAPDAPTVTPAPASADLEGRIVFRGIQDGNLEIFAVDGSGLERLTDAPGIEGAPVWSPDGSRIAFTTTSGGGDWKEALEVFVMNADGSGETRLTDSEDRDYEVTWSPDGSRIAFVSHRDSFLGDLLVMNADGSDQTTIAKGAYGPAWSPAGDRIAFTDRTEYAVPEIHVVNVDGSGRTPLTETPSSAGKFAFNASPYWSPDGSRIAYISFAGGDGGRRLFVMNADGSGQTQLADEATVTDGSQESTLRLAWSPDGSRIAYAAPGTASSVQAFSNVEGIASGRIHSQYVFDLYVVDADGSSPPTLLAEGGHSGVWSPDSSRIAFLFGPLNGNDLYVMGADGSNRTRLTELGYLDGPAWQPAPSPSP